MHVDAYAQHAAYEDRHWWFVARRIILEQILSHWFAQSTIAAATDVRSSVHSRTILEVGSGTGGNLPMLGQFGRVFAYEPVAEGRRFSSEKYPDITHLEHLNDAAPLAPFDVIGLFDVLEHADDPLALLRQLQPWLRQTGLLLITVPACSWLYSEHDRFLHHHRRYESHELQSQIESAGFEVIQIASMNSLLFPLACAGRLAHSLLKTPVKDTMATPPAAPINQILMWLFSLERHWLPSRTAGFGLSLVALARRRT